MEAVDESVHDRARDQFEIPDAREHDGVHEACADE
jgi:hypothetical protein